MANWTPSGFIGELFRVTGARFAGRQRAQSSATGDEANVGERFSHHATDIKIRRMMAQLTFPFSISETVEFYRLYYGPTVRAFAGLPRSHRQRFGATWRISMRSHKATDGTTSIAAEYLEVVATRN